MKIEKGKKGAKNTAVMEFESLTDLTEFIKENSRPTGHSRAHHNSDFCQFNWDQSIDMLENGWPEGVSKMEAIVGEIEGSGDGETIMIDYNVTGDFCNIGMLMAGEPECMGRRRKKPVKNKEINIMVNANYCCSITEAAIMNRGAAIQALIDKLMENYHVNVQFVCQTRDCCNWDYVHTVTADTSNSYSKELIAFCCGNPAYLRRIDFAIAEWLAGVDNCCGYGISEDVPAEKLKDMKIDIYFPKLNYSEVSAKWSTPEKAKEEIMRIVNRIADDRKAEEGADTYTDTYTPPPPPHQEPFSGQYDQH